MKTILSAAAVIAVLSLAPAAWAQTQGDTATPFDQSSPDTVSPAEAPDVGVIYYQNLPQWAERAFIPPDSRDTSTSTSQ